MEGRINWRARYGSVDTSGSLTILENTFLSRDNIYIYIYIKKKNIVSHGCFEGRSCSSLGPKDGQRLWGREKLRFVGSKVCEEIIFDYGANTRYPIFFFRTGVWSFWGRGKGKPSIFMGVEEERLDCETLAYLCDN